MVVDACQLRSDARNIVDYAGLGFVTLITGSKFYCGPPFSGAVLFPPAALRELETGFKDLPSGFDDYFTRHEVTRCSCCCQMYNILVVCEHIIVVVMEYGIEAICIVEFAACGLGCESVTCYTLLRSRLS